MRSSWISLTCVDNIGFDVVFDEKHESLFSISNEQVLRYSFGQNAWIKHKTNFLIASHVGLQHKARAMDGEQQKIFINYKHGTIAIFTLHDNNQITFDVINDLDGVYDGEGSQGIMINNEFHIIGGIANKHIKYGPNDKKIQVLHDFSDVLDVNGIQFHQIVRVKNKIILFGGFDTFDFPNDVDTVNEYDIIADHWRKLNCKLPKACSGQQYVVLFGDMVDNDKEQNHVFMYSVIDETFKRSRIKCPFKGDCRAFAINDREKDDIVTVGFLRSRWIQSGMNEHLFPPQYLIQIICGYYWNECINLLEIGARNHFKIDVFKLFEM